MQTIFREEQFETYRLCQTILPQRSNNRCPMEQPGAQIHKVYDVMEKLPGTNRE